MSVLAQIFSSKALRGHYADEKPLIDFEFQGTDQEKRRLISMVNKIATYSETGKAVLQKAAENGYSLSFKMQSGTYGFANPENKQLVLNPCFRDGDLLNTLVHEARHAGQFANGVTLDFGLLNVRSEVLEFRAMEADACAMATYALLEAQKNGLKQRGMRDEASNKTRQMFDEGKDMKDVLKTAFDNWYDNRPLKESYEDSYIIHPMRDALKKHEESSMPYSLDVSPEKVVEMVCCTQNGCYFNNPDELNADRYMDIAPGTKIVAEQFFKVREMRTGQAPDESYKTLPVREGMTMLHGSIAGKCYDIKPKGRKKTPVLAKALKRKER